MLLPKAAWWEEVNAKLTQRKTAGLDLDSSGEYEDLVKVLIALPDIKEGTPKRILSQMLFQDTKHFEQTVERRLLGILRRFFPEEFERDEEYLDNIGIVENPKLTLLTGPVVFSTGKSTVNLEFFPGGIGLSMGTIRFMEIKEIKARTILFIENLTTYYHMVETYGKQTMTNYGPSANVMDKSTELKEPVLLIYTGGFPHKGTQKFLLKLASFIRRSTPNDSSDYAEVEIYHWGDMDYGGIKIFEYLKRNFFQDLKPYRMDIAAYKSFLHKGMPMGEDQAEKLKKLLEDPSYAQWHTLIEEMLNHRKRIEQESINPLIF